MNKFTARYVVQSNNDLAELVSAFDRVSKVICPDRNAEVSVCRADHHVFEIMPAYDESLLYEIRATTGLQRVFMSDVGITVRLDNPDDVTEPFNYRFLYRKSS